MPPSARSPLLSSLCRTVLEARRQEGGLLIILLPPHTDQTRVLRSGSSSCHYHMLSCAPHPELFGVSQRPASASSFRNLCVCVCVIGLFAASQAVNKPPFVALLLNQKRTGERLSTPAWPFAWHSLIWSAQLAHTRCHSAWASSTLQRRRVNPRWRAVLAK